LPPKPVGISPDILRLINFYGDDEMMTDLTNEQLKQLAEHGKNFPNL
jgi:hypothetical protein